MMVEVGEEVGLARVAVAAAAVVAVAAEGAVEVAMEKGAEAAGAPGAGRSRHSRCRACKLEMGVHSCVARSHCNRCPDCRMRTQLQGHRRHRCRLSDSRC